MAQDTHSEEETTGANEELEDTELSPDERIEKLEERCQELNSLWLRAQADYQNLRRRSLTDYEAGLRREIQPLLDELLLVLDFLDLALSSPAESDDAKTLAQGVQMTRAKLEQALETAGVRTIPTDGPFDPAIHEATETREEEGKEPGTILVIVRRGYTWHDQVLRHAHVIVAAGEPPRKRTKAGPDLEPMENEADGGQGAE